MRRGLIGSLIAIVLLAVWVFADLASDSRRSLRDFDGREVGRLETAMWRSYYGHQQVRLFLQLGELLRRQYHMPFWRSCLGAYHAAKAAVVFQKGHGRAEYERALPDLVSFYQLILRGSTESFDVRQTAGAELEWWISHRERAHLAAGALESSLARLQAQLYHQPVGEFATHARLRAEAMLLRDERAAQGKVSEEDWARIGTLLDGSWSNLAETVSASSAARLR